MIKLAVVNSYEQLPSPENLKTLSACATIEIQPNHLRKNGGSAIAPNPSAQHSIFAVLKLDNQSTNSQASRARPPAFDLATTRQHLYSLIFTTLTRSAI